MCITFYLGNNKRGKIYDANELYLTKEASLKKEIEDPKTIDVIREVFQAFAEMAEEGL